MRSIRTYIINLPKNEKCRKHMDALCKKYQLDFQRDSTIWGCRHMIPIVSCCVVDV